MNPRSHDDSSFFLCLLPEFILPVYTSLPVGCAHLLVVEATLPVAFSQSPEAGEVREPVPKKIISTGKCLVLRV